MITRVTAVEFDRVVRSGRTKPVILGCVDQKGGEEGEIELYAKLSSRCEQGVIHLAREAIAACLAGDLGLPVPQPFLVNLPRDWVATVPDSEVRAAMAASSPVAFGSRLAGAQFSTWHSGVNLRPSMIDTALGILAFDAIIQNDDRREGNSNCLVLGEHLRIIDHELSFPRSQMIIGWQPPWKMGSLERFRTPGFHIFRDRLRRIELDFAPIGEAWRSLSDHMIEGYASAVPPEWSLAHDDVLAAIALIRGARDHIDECLREIGRVLTT